MDGQMPAKDASDDARLIAAIDGDGQRFAIDKLEAHRKGLLHDAVSVFVFDGEDMLIQQRAAAKYHCPGLWANACCTHPDWGEVIIRSRLYRPSFSISCRVSVIWFRNAVVMNHLRVSTKVAWRMNFQNTGNLL